MLRKQTIPSDVGRLLDDGPADNVSANHGKVGGQWGLFPVPGLLVGGGRGDGSSECVMPMCLIVSWGHWQGTATWCQMPVAVAGPMARHSRMSLRERVRGSVRWVGGMHCGSLAMMNTTHSLKL